MRTEKRRWGRYFLSIKTGIVITMCLLIGSAWYYHVHVILYEKQLNIFVSYLYDDVSPKQVTAVYQRLLNVDSFYKDRIKKDLESALISRYQYYANLYMLRKIEYEAYLQYEQIVEPLFFSNDKVTETIEEVETFYQSQRAYLKGLTLQQQGLIEEAIDAYQEVLFNDQYYYDLAKVKKGQCLQSIKDQYMSEANTYYEQRNYIEAIKRLDYLNEAESDESVSALKWYYQSEFYVEAMKVIDASVEADELGAALSYLTQITEMLGTQYADTLELKQSELSLARASRRDKVMSKYAAKIQVNLNTESSQQMISYNGIPLQSQTSFNMVTFATNAFTMVKKAVDESVEEDEVEQYINMMPLLMTNSELTTASMPLLLGYYGESLNEFTEVDIYEGNQLLYSFTVNEDEKRQVWIEDRVVEWAMIEASYEQVESMINDLNPNQQLTIIFKGPQLKHQFELQPLEIEIIQMMAQIYQSIIK